MVTEAVTAGVLECCLRTANPGEMRSMTTVSRHSLMSTSRGTRSRRCHPRVASDLVGVLRNTGAFATVLHRTLTRYRSVVDPEAADPDT